MDEIEFNMNGHRFRLNRQDVIQALKQEQPEPIQKWAVEVDGTLFPVKQALSASIKEERGVFISHRARDLFRKLDFRVVDIERDGVPANTPDVIGGDGADGENAGMSQARLNALTLAVEYSKRRSNLSLDEVLKIAQSFEAWLER